MFFPIAGTFAVARTSEKSNDYSPLPYGPPGLVLVGGTTVYIALVVAAYYHRYSLGCPKHTRGRGYCMAAGAVVVFVAATAPIVHAPLLYAPRSVATMAIAMEKNETTRVRHLVGMRLKKYVMRREKGEWNGEDGMKAAEHDTTIRNTRPSPNILPITNPNFSWCPRIDKLCICQTWKFQNWERMKLTTKWILRKRKRQPVRNGKVFIAFLNFHDSNPPNASWWFIARS